MSVAEAFVTVRPDMNRFGSELHSGARGSLNRLSDTVGRWARRAFLAAGAVAGASLFGGLQRVLDTEDARKLFGQLGLGVGETDDLMGQLEDTFRTGPFAFPDVFDVSSQLLASGVAMEDLVGFTESIGNLAAFAGEDLSRVGEITQIIGANGRVTARELNRLGQMGVPIRQILADALDVSGDELSDLVSAGELSSEMFFELIGDAEQFEGAMEQFASTTRGAWAVFKAGMAGAGEALLAPWFGEDGTMVSFLNRVNGVLFDRVQPALEAFGGWLHEVGTGAIEGTLIPALQRLSEWMSTYIAPVFRRVAEFVSENSEAFQRIGEAILVALPMVAGIATAIGLVTKAFALLVALSPAGLVVGIAAALVYAWQNSETFRTVVTTVFEAVRTVIETVFSVVTTIIETFVEWATAAWDRWGDDITAIAEGAWTIISTVVGGVLTWIQELIAAWVVIFQEIWDRWGDEITAVAEAVWDGILNIIDTVLGVIRGVIDTVTAAIEGDWSAVWESILGILQTVWDGIVGGVQVGIGLAKGLINGGLTLISDWWESVWSWVSTFVSDTWSDVVGSIESGVDSAVEWVESLKDRIMEFFSDAGTWLKEAGKDIVGGLIEGIGDMVTAAGDKAGEVASAIRDRFPFSPAREGPLSGSGSPELAGRKIVEMLSDGIGSADGLTDGLEARLKDLTELRPPSGSQPSRHGATYEVNVQAWSDRFSLRQIEDELAFRGAV